MNHITVEVTTRTGIEIRERYRNNLISYREAMDAVAALGIEPYPFLNHKGSVKRLAPAAARFMAHKPVLVGIVLGYRFYEHPTRGDDAPLVVITPDGKKRPCDWYDVPSTEQMIDAIKQGI